MSGVNPIVVNIEGTSAGAVAAVDTAAASFDSLSVAAASSAADIAAAMSSLAAVIDGLAAEVDVLAASMDNLAASSGTAAVGVEEAGTAGSTASVEVLGLSDAVTALTGAFDSLMGSIMPVIETLGTLIAVMGAMAIIQDVSSWIENLIQQMFQLDNQTQRVVNSWQYLFAEAPGGGKAAGQRLAAWAYQESPKLPFTAVDLRSGISTLGTIPGISPDEIEKFMPILADIASTLGASDFGGQGINLQQAAQAIVGAQFGLTRQLRYELHINPQELLKYGLVGRATATGLRITDPSTLIPAIERWAAHRGLAGAAQEQETSTFWGAFSSFQDYLQNALQTTGGIDPATGQVVPGSMFGGISKILYGINAMLGPAQAGKGGPLQGIETGVGGILGGGVQGFISAFQGMVSGLQSSGAGKVAGDLLKEIENFGNWLQSSGVQEKIKEFGQVIGQWIGENLNNAKGALPDFVNSIRMLAGSFEMLWSQVTPQQRQNLQYILNDIIEITGFLIKMVSGFVIGASLFLGAINHISTTVQSWGMDLRLQFQQWGQDFIQWLIHGIESQLGNFAGVLGRLASIPANFLRHQSPPKEGPMADDDMWMPNMMEMFASGIQRGLPAVARASQMAALAIGGPMAAAGHLYTGGGVSNTTYGPTLNYGGGTTHNTFYGNSMMQLEMAIHVALEDMDRRGALIQQAPGGRYLFGQH